MSVKTLLLSLLASLVAHSAFARLGETKDECETRYGFARGQMGNGVTYLKDHITIIVVYKDDHSVRETFVPEGGSFLHEEQIDDLLNANSRGSKWNMVNEDPVAGYRKYGLANGELFALYEWRGVTATQEKMGTSLTIRVWNKGPEKKPSDSGF